MHSEPYEYFWCRYGWIDQGFKNFIANKYPWIRLLFVPASCTPVAQPMDAGIIAKIKGKLRKLYGMWVVTLTRDQLKNNVPPEKIKIPADVPTCKSNLFEWLSTVVDQCNEDQSGIIHCWEKTDLLKAWDRAVQVALPALCPTLPAPCFTAFTSAHLTRSHCASPHHASPTPTSPAMHIWCARSRRLPRSRSCSPTWPTCRMST